MKARRRVDNFRKYLKNDVNNETKVVSKTLHDNSKEEAITVLAFPQRISRSKPYYQTIRQVVR